MKKIVLTLLILIATQITFAQQAYYDDVDLTLTGIDLYFELQDKIDITNNTFTYGEVRDVVKVTDENPAATNEVLLVYGFDNGDGNCTTDRSRDKEDFGGTNCEYNREHVFARSNADPEMGSANNSSTGIRADPHNLRPSDQSMNGNRGSKKFADGSGTAGDVGSGNWFPGDEWKGDVARMMMYMYTRYSNRCLPSLNGAGPTQGSTNMLQVYLKWNAEDPVSILEDQRNPHLEVVYGNRNPFIDNPYLATIIWGGPPAEDRWNLFDIDDNFYNSVAVYPNPATSTVYVQNDSGVKLQRYVLFDVFGKKVLEGSLGGNSNRLSVETIAQGMYLLELQSDQGSAVKKIIVN